MKRNHAKMCLLLNVLCIVSSIMKIKTNSAIRFVLAVRFTYFFIIIFYGFRYNRGNEFFTNNIFFCFLFFSSFLLPSSILVWAAHWKLFILVFSFSFQRGFSVACSVSEKNRFRKWTVAGNWVVLLRIAALLNGEHC